MSRKSSRFVLAALSAALLFAASPHAAQCAAADGLRGGPDEGAATESGPGGPLRIHLAGAEAHMLAIPKGKSAIIDLPVDARDVMLTSPGVAEPIMRSPRRVSILGVTPGQTDAVFYDATGRKILSLNIRVDQDFSALADTISRIIPGAHIRVEGVNNGVILSGQVSSLTDASRAVQIAQQFTSKPEQVVNMLSIEGKDQVMLRVRIVEVQRSVIKQLGFNLQAATNLALKAGIPAYSLTDNATFGVNGSLLGGLTNSGVLASNGAGTAKIGGTVDAFERAGLVRTLAEPNLTAVSGESAKFLAGGEFPVPTGEDSTGKVTIEFKPYGVGLGFTPVVLSGGRISLKVSTEVSELTNQGSFTLAAGSGNASLTVPGLTVRRTETTVEMPSGGAMMISGLLQEETKQNIDSLPGLMNLPVLGALFRSRDYQEGETELVIIIMPYLVGPTNPANLQTPADGLQIANDAETDLLGRLNKVYKTPATVAGRTYQGPVGYVIE